MLAEATSFLTPDMVQPLVDMVSGNAEVLLPKGIVIMGIMIGIGLIPRIIYKFL